MQTMVKADANRSGTLAEATEFLRGLTQRHERIAVTGRPGVGKTFTMRPLLPELEAKGWLVESSDDLVLQAAWDDQVRLLLATTDSRERWMLEGVTVARALRHGLTADAVVVFRGSPLRPRLTPAAMRLGDQVYKWVEEAQSLRPKTAFYFWDVRERKYG